jgi:outer membrane protein OmpA-like peptidoglycan-associated protein
MNIANTLLAAACLIAFTGATADPVYYGKGAVPRPIDVAKALMGAQYQPKMRMRGVDLGGNASEPVALGQSATAEIAPQNEPSPGAQGLDVAIQFGFDSDRLLSESFATLDSLAEGIKLTPTGQAVTIFGHTDATGSELYNQILSERRANAVRSYLIEKHGISPGKLQSFGRGEGQLLLPQAPFNGKNRRVGFAIG